MNQSALAQTLSFLSTMIHQLSGGQAPQVASVQQKSSFDTQMRAKGWYQGSDGIYRESTPAATITSVPTPTPVPQSALGQFRYKMGLKDYSFLKPQLLKLFQARNNPPLAQYIDNFIQSGNQHGVDPRILVTIANNESSLGKSYPTQTYNPFGYLGGQGSTVNEKLNAGFTSIPHAIEAITNRFTRPGTPQGYNTFRNDPTVANLQQAYNANPAERERYLQNTAAILPYFKD